MLVALRIGIAGCIALILAVALEGRVCAQSPQERVEAGVSEFQDLEFSKAIATLSEVVESRAATPSQRILALELIAISHLSLGETKKAKRAFAELLKLRPEYELRHHDGSPKVSAVFEEVRRAMPKATPAEPAESPSPNDENTRLSWGDISSGRAGGKLNLVVQAKGRAPSSVVLLWRAQGSRDFDKVRMRRLGDGRWRARVRLPKSRQDYDLEYYAVAEGPAGETLERLGDEDQPERYLIFGRGGGRSRRKSSWLGNWKVWAGVGTVALLGGSFALLNSGSDQLEGTLSPGRITLSP